MSRKHINLYTLKWFEKALNAEEKQQIVQNLVKGRTPSQIAKNLQRDTRTIQKFIRKIVYKDKDINRALSRGKYLVCLDVFAKSHQRHL